MSTQNGNKAFDDNTPVKVCVNYTVCGEKLSVIQPFHQKYISEEGILDTDVLAVAQEVHGQLYRIGLILGLKYGEPDDRKGGLRKDPNLEALFTCRGLRDSRMGELHEVVISMETGSFSFKCQKTKCPRYGHCPEGHNLTETLKALPEAKACLWFRKEYGSGLPIPEGRKSWGV